MLSDYLEKALEIGSEEIEIEYKDGYELITAFRGSLGVGIGSIRSREAEPLFDEITDLKRKKKVTIGGISYKVTVSTYESFGEWAYRIRLESPERIPKTAKGRL